MNIRGAVASDEVREYLASELPQAPIFRRLPPAPGVPMAALGDWLVILAATESVLAIGAALWAVWERFRPRSNQDAKLAKPGVFIELRNASGEVAIITIGADSGGREVFIGQFSEKADLLARSGTTQTDELQAQVERSGTWIKIR